MDLVHKEIDIFESQFLQNVTSSNKLYLFKELYVKLESYYLFDIEKESWIGNLEQEFAPLFKIYFRGKNYEKELMNNIEIDEFIDSLYKSLRHEAINNNNNFVFSDTDFVGGDVCEKLFNNGLCLPSGSNLNEVDLNRVVRVIEQKFK